MRGGRSGESERERDGRGGRERRESWRQRRQRERQSGEGEREREQVQQFDNINKPKLFLMKILKPLVKKKRNKSKKGKD